MEQVDIKYNLTHHIKKSFKNNPDKKLEILDLFKNKERCCMKTRSIMNDELYITDDKDQYKFMKKIKNIDRREKMNFISRIERDIIMDNIKVEIIINPINRLLNECIDRGENINQFADKLKIQFSEYIN